MQVHCHKFHAILSHHSDLMRVKMHLFVTAAGCRVGLCTGLQGRGMEWGGGGNMGWSGGGSMGGLGWGRVCRSEGGC